MLKPINGNFVIEPAKHDSFVPTTKGNYEEKGVVVEVPDGGYEINKGDVVFFDSWLVGKYPKNEKEFFWVVNYKDIKAIERDV